MPHRKWGSVQIGSDDIFVPGWIIEVAPWDGHIYAPEEWAEEQMERARNRKSE